MSLAGKNGNDTDSGIMKSKQKRTASNDRFKAFVNEELKGMGVLGNGKKESSIDDKKHELKVSSHDDFSSSDEDTKKKSHNDLWASPSTRGYFSDSCLRPRTRKLHQELERSSNQVSLDDFEYIKKIG
mmetsp:Transcript_36935/g.33207  ORF Transcript_36935/g.33207 Transcript_36935/m.33207 type:complete len:128 (+) Transcript_36935:1805-2188(+)